MEEEREWKGGLKRDENGREEELREGEVRENMGEKRK